MTTRLAVPVFAAALLVVAGCGGSGNDSSSTESATLYSLPLGAVAVVGATPIATAAYRHWLPIVGRREGDVRRAKDRTVSFLVEAQWVQQQAARERVDDAGLHRLLERELARQPPHPHTTRADLAFELRIKYLSQALGRNHDKSPQPTVTELNAYYKAHPSEFTVPAVRETRLVVARSRPAALRARSALDGGQSWPAVARHFSIDASAAIGGRYPVVAGVSPPSLVRAAFSAARHRLVGPLRARLPVGGSHPVYYLLEVIKSLPPKPQPLSTVKVQVVRRVEEANRSRALASFSRSFERRWRARTLCAPAYLVPQCRNYRAAKAGSRRP